MVSRQFLIATLIIAAQFAALNQAGAQDAKTEYEHAIDLFHAEEFSAALPFFRKAYTLSSRRPSTILGLAQCERALRMFDDAVEHFEEFLATKPNLEEAQRVEETLRLVRLMMKARPERNAQKPSSKVRAENLMAPPVAPTARSIQDQETSSIWAAPWIWITAVAVVGVAIGASVSLSGETAPYPGNTGVVLQGLVSW